MAFHGGVDAGKGIGAAICHQVAELLHEAAVAAAVTGEGGVGDGSVDDLLGVAEAVDDDLLFEHIALDIAQGAGDFDGAVVVVGEGGHGEGGVDISAELQVHRLVVHHVVVAVEDAAAVGAGTDGVPDLLLGGFACKDVAGPAVAHLLEAAPLAGDVEFFRVIGAVVPGLTAVEAAEGGTGGAFSARK